MPCTRTARHGEQPDTVAENVAALEAQIRHLRLAMISHERIGIATGLIAGRFRSTPEQALRALIFLSQDTNTKLHLVARIVTDAHSEQLSPEHADLSGRFERLLGAMDFARCDAEQRPSVVDGDRTTNCP